MSDFFEPPPPQPVPAPQRYRQPTWAGPPEGALPGIVPVEIVLARNNRVAVCVSRLGAYPTGFEFDVVTMAAGDQHEVDPMLFDHPHHPGAGSGIPPDVLRIGVQFSDGAKVTNTGGFPPIPDRRTARSWFPVAAEAVEDAGARRSGCGRCHRLARSRWCANGRRWRSR